MNIRSDPMRNRGTTSELDAPRKLDALRAKSRHYAGGVQSNHCRATAVAARYLGLDSHLILRAPQSVADAGDPGLVGNLMVERMVGANVHLVGFAPYHPTPQVKYR